MPDNISQNLMAVYEFLKANFFGYFFVAGDGLFLPGYFLWSAVLFVVFYVFLSSRLKSRKNISNTQPTLNIKQTRREIIFSITSSIIFGITDLVIFVAIGKFFKVYNPTSGIGDTLWLIASVPLLFIMHDTFFYWSHRAMHHPKIFRHVHKLHHLSKATTPFTAISFHPIEAVIEGSWYVIPTIIFGFHPIAFLIFTLGQTFHTVFNHLGYEPFLKGFTKHPILGIKTTPTHHSMHHEKVGGNYGLYFTFWDRLMGTEFKDYHQRFEELTN